MISCDLLGQLQNKKLKASVKFKLLYISDSSEALGVKYNKKHTGFYSDLATLSFNGNKIITTENGVYYNTKQLQDKFLGYLRTKP